jgi:hypothetical protein
MISTSHWTLQQPYLFLCVDLNSPLSVKLAAVRWSEGGRFGLEFIKMDRPEQQTLDAFMTEHLSTAT